MNNQDGRAAVVKEAESWLLTPYHHQGRIKGSGVDCAMLLAEVYENTGHIPHVDPRPYPPDWHLNRSEERYIGWVDKYAREVKIPMPGDIALFKFGRCVSHGAIIVQWPIIIHSYLHEGVLLADGEHGILAGRLHKFYSIFKDA
jgi:cell wall-associated NlpC family hydrolase